jgi:hypothetical protein
MALSLLICSRMGTTSDLDTLAAAAFASVTTSGSNSPQGSGSTSFLRESISEATDLARSINADRSASISSVWAGLRTNSGSAEFVAGRRCRGRRLRISTDGISTAGDGSLSGSPSASGCGCSHTGVDAGAKTRSWAFRWNASMGAAAGGSVRPDCIAAIAVFNS